MLEDLVANAANDEKYFSQRCRTLPIPTTITAISGYPSKLRIFLTNASPYWQAKCFFKGKTYTRSLRTTSKRVAIAAARDFFHVTSAQVYGVNYIEQVRNDPDKHPFRSIAGHALAIETARCQRNELSKTGLRILTSRLNVRLLPHFGDMAVEDIGYAELANFIGLLSEEGTSSTTMAQYLVAIRKVLNYAQSLNLIPHLPKFPQVKVRNNPRGSFTLNEYMLLLRAAKQWAGKRIEIKTTSKSQRGAGVKDKNLTMPFDMAWLIGFMVNSFIRPSDLKTLQHQHVEIIRGEHIYLRLNLPETKKHDTPIVTLQPAVRIYTHLLAHAKLKGYAKPTDYLFMPHQRNRTKAIEWMGFAFQHILKETGLIENAANQQKRTIYSLRHTAITFRLLYGKGIDLLTLARNARTSVDMIEKFYASNLSAEMNIGMLQSRRSKDA